jgi:hypothetical protein
VSLYKPPGKYVRFGDIFDAPHLIATYLRADAVELGSADLPATLAPKVGKRLGVELPEEPLRLYGPLLRKREQEDFVLAHGKRERAILLTDNCTISTIFGYDRDKPRRTGALMFAPVRDEPDQIEKVRTSRPFNRFALEQAAFFPAGGIVDFRRVCMVDARDIDPKTRVAALGDELAEDLEASLAAYAVRRGPNVVDRNVAKLAGLLTGAGIDEHAAEGSAARIADALGVAWRLEGGPLEDAAEAYDDRKDPEPPLRALAADFRDLARTAAAAAEDLERQLVAIT